MSTLLKEELNKLPRDERKKNLKETGQMKLAYDLYTPPFSVQQDLEPIILLHSIVETKDTWKSIALPLAVNTGRRVYALDLRNHGESPWTDEYNVEIMCEDLRQFFSHHHIQRAILLGHSLGGKVAICFSLKEPSKVKKLIVEDSPVRKIKLGNNTMVSTILILIRKGVEELKEDSDEVTAIAKCRNILRQFTTILYIDEDLADVYRFEYLPFKWEGKSHQILFDIDKILDSIQNESLQLHDAEGKYDGDTLFIIGKKSQFKVHKDESIEEHFPQSTKVIFENSGHLIHQTLPDEYLRIVTDFINHGTKQRSKY